MTTDSKPDYRESLKHFSFLAGSSIISFVFLNFAINTLGFFVGQPVGLAQFWISLLLTLGLNIYISLNLFQKKLSAILLSILSLIVIFGAVCGSLWVSNRFYDISYDGQAYHQEAILQLNDGWNPVTTRAKDRHQIWLNAYPKSAWINSDTVFKLTGKIELGKMFNLLVSFAAFMLVLAALLAFKRLNKFWVLPISILAVANPVTLYQIYNYYIDGQMYAVMLSLLSIFGLILNTKFEAKSKLNWIYTFVFVAAGVYLFNIKLVGMVFGTVFLIGMLIYSGLLRRDIFSKILTNSALVFVLGFLVFGYNPYITNYRYNGSPFFPVLGKGAYDFKTENLPNNFAKKNNLEVLFLSGFLETSNVRGEKDIGVTKTPFTYSENEQKALMSENIKKGGFGVYFGGAVIILLVTLASIVAYYLVKNRQNLKDEKADNFLKVNQVVFEFLVFSFIILLVLFSSGLNSAATYARFVPQMWIIPVIFVIYLALFKNKVIQIVAAIVCALLLFNSYLVINEGIKGHIIEVDKVISKLNDFKKKYTTDKPLIIDFNNATATRQRLQDFNIPFEEQKTLTCKEHRQYVIPDNESDICTK